MSLQIVVFCLSPVTVLSLSCLLDKLLAHPSELQPLLDIHLSYLLQPPIGVPACEDIHAVSNRSNENTDRFEINIVYNC